MHFLEQVVNTPQLKDPAEKHMDVHRHFTKYSRGVFSGPALKIAKTSSKITLKGSRDYEDLIQEIVIQALPESNISVKGVLITTEDISDRIADLGLTWGLKASTGQTKNFKADFSEEVSREKLLKIIEAFRTYAYLLINFKNDANYKVSTKIRLPQPSKKQPMEEDINSMVNFCTGVLKTNKDNVNRVIKSALFDFQGEIPEEWKQISLMNNYKISDLEVPKNLKDSKLLRSLAIRKGELERIISVDGKDFKKQYSIVV